MVVQQRRETDPKEALDVFDFEPVARKNLPPAHFGYLATGSDDEVTLRANREGFLDGRVTLDAAPRLPGQAGS